MDNRVLLNYWMGIVSTSGFIFFSVVSEWERILIKRGCIIPQNCPYSPSYDTHCVDVNNKLINNVRST